MTATPPPPRAVGPVEVEALRALLAKATQDDPLPWEWDGRRVIGPDHTYVPQGSSLGPTLIQLGDTYENHGAHCDLVAAAVNAIPDLFATLDALQARLAAAEGVVGAARVVATDVLAAAGHRLTWKEKDALLALRASLPTPPAPSTDKENA